MSFCYLLCLLHVHTWKMSFLNSHPWFNFNIDIFPPVPVTIQLTNCMNRQHPDLFFLLGGEQTVEECLGSWVLALFAARLCDTPAQVIDQGVWRHPQTFNIRAWLERKAARVFRGRSCAKRPYTPGKWSFSQCWEWWYLSHYWVQPGTAWLYIKGTL